MSTSILAGNILPLAQFKARASEVLNGMKADNKAPGHYPGSGAFRCPPAPEEYDRLVERSEFFFAAVEAGPRRLDDRASS